MNTLTTNLLKIEKLTKRFNEIIALDSISLEISKGEIHAILGENGAGKSTLANCIYGVYKPDFGGIYLNDQRVSFNSPRGAINIGIGMVHQHFVLAKKMSAIENIIVGIKTANKLLDLNR